MTLHYLMFGGPGEGPDLSVVYFPLFRVIVQLFHESPLITQRIVRFYGKTKFFCL